MAAIMDFSADSLDKKCNDVKHGGRVFNRQLFIVKKTVDKKSGVSWNRNI